MGIIFIWKSGDMYMWRNKSYKITRSQGSHHLVQHVMNELSSRTFFNDETRVWNQAPKVVKMAETIYSAKQEIKKFVRMLPI